MKNYLIILHPTYSYWRWFLVTEENPKRAIYKLQFNLRKMYQSLKEANPNDQHGKVKRAKDVVKASRRWKRFVTSNAFGKKRQRVCDIYEISTGSVYEGHLQLCVTEDLLCNILPKIPLQEVLTL